MKILQTVKYYDPSQGGMESVVKNLVEGVLNLSERHEFTVYANSHLATWKSSLQIADGITSIKEATPLLFKSQPLNLRYRLLGNLLIKSDIIHHHYPFPNIEIALLRNIEIIKTKKFIVTWHANIKNSRWSWISAYYDPIIKRLLDEAEHIVVTSPQLFEASVALQGYADKVEIIPLSYNPLLSMEESLPKTLPLNRKFRLLFVGKLRAYKGLDILLNAVKKLDVLLTILGDGEQEGSLRALVISLGIEQKVLFLKDMSNSDLILEYRKADLFVLPSINEAEAFGVVQLEAMSNGLPVINTQLDSGVPHVSLNGCTGITVQPGNAADLEKAICTIMGDPLLYASFSKNSIERAKLFTMHTMAEKYLNLYNS